MLSRHTYSGTLFLAASLFVTAPVAHPATIFSVDGPNDDSLSGESVFVGVGASFTTSSPYTNVTLWTTILFGATGTVNLEVYLTNQIGAGTTAANEVASTTLEANSDSGTPSGNYILLPLNLLSISALDPGTYFLTVRGTAWTGGNFPQIARSEDTSLVVVTDTGVTVDPKLYAGGWNGYLPEGTSSFAGSFTSSYWFAAEGTASAGIPEPSTTALCLAGATLLFCARRGLKGPRL